MSKNGYPDGTLDDELLKLTHRVSLIEMTRAYDPDARPVHVVQSRYQIIGDKWDACQEILWKFNEDSKTGDVWKEYPQVLLKLQEILAPKVAKELLDAYTEQYKLAKY